MEKNFEILIVDADEVLTFNLKNTLEKAGYCTTIAHYGRTALTFCYKKTFDLAIIDTKLPDMHSARLIEKLTELSSRTLHIIITGYSSPDITIEDMKLKSIVAREPKPLSMDHVLSLVRQIGERKDAEGALKESEARYHTLLDLGTEVGEAIVILQDTEHEKAIQAFVSPQWLRITGYSEEELLGIPFFNLVHARDREASMDRYYKQMQGEIIPGLFEIAIIRKDVVEIPIELTSACTTYQGERANVAYIRDISGRRQMQEQLIVADRLASVGELASGIAHEINNPLTCVIGFAKLLLDKDIPDDAKEDVEIIYDEAQRTAQIVKKLLTFARKSVPAKQMMNLEDVLEKVLELRTHEQQLNNIQINARCAPDLPEVMADYFQLQQVFLNIIINAEYFMVKEHNRGTLTIIMEKVDNTVKTSFIDDGPGITEEDMGHLFDPFFTTKEVGQGTGLGLSICHGIVSEHGGRIYAECEPGKGSVFIVELPINDH